MRDPGPRDGAQGPHLARPPPGSPPGSERPPPTKARAARLPGGSADGGISVGVAHQGTQERVCGCNAARVGPHPGAGTRSRVQQRRRSSARATRVGRDTRYILGGHLAVGAHRRRPTIVVGAAALALNRTSSPIQRPRRLPRGLLRASVPGFGRQRQRTASSEHGDLPDALPA